MKLTAKLLIAVAAALLLTGSITAIILITWFRTGITDEIVENQTKEAVKTLDTIDRFLNERMLDVQNLSGRSQITAVLDNSNSSADAKALLNGQFADYKDVASHWDALTVITTDHKVIASNIVNLASQQELFDRTAVKEILANGLGGNTVYSDVVKTNDTTASVIIVTPVRSNRAGRPVIGAIVGQLSWNTILDILKSVDSTRAYLINKDGIDIGDNQQDDQKDLLSKKYNDAPAYRRAQQNTENSRDGSSQPSLEIPELVSLSTFAHQDGFGLYKGNGWLLILETPANKAFATIGPLIRNIIILIGICVLLVIFVLVFAFQRIFIRPIHQLGQGIAAITTGHLYTRIQRKSKDELGDLTDAFNNMAHNLQSAYRGLERQTFMTEMNRARLIASVNGLKQGFIIINKDFTVELLNDTVAKSFNLEGKGAQLPIEVVLGKLGKNADLLVTAVKDCVLTGRGQEFQNIAYDDRILQIYMAPVTDKSSTVGAVILMEDVTEEQLLQRSKDEFFSIASHELRTPLTAIRGNAALIIEYFSDQLKDPNLKEMVNDIHGSSVRLIDIVNDFLDASRLEQGKMRFKYDAVHMDKIIESVIYELEGVSREKNIFLKFENKLIGSLPPVYGDKDRLKQVVYNLTGNALKFTEIGGITIWAEPVGKLLKVFIQDTGNGIPVAEQHALFRKFEQTSSSNFTRDTTRGTGLGLYISKLIVENMGGAIKLESTETGKGSVFSFTVPLMNEETSAQTAADTGKKMSIPVYNGSSTPVSNITVTATEQTPTNVLKS